MRVGVLGINYKLADLKLRELLSKVCQRRFGLVNSIHCDRSFVLLSTCNRTEIYFSSEDLPRTHTYLINILRQEILEEFDQKLYSYFGNDCFLHLSRVTAGLDSAIVGETEIQGQVKCAYESASEYNQLNYELHYMFQKALKIGKQIRSSFPAKPGLPGLEHAVYNTGQHKFKNPQDLKVLFFGVSDINCKILEYFKVRNFTNITICNRTREHAEELAEQHKLHVLPWTEMTKCWEYDWLIFGTKFPDYLITRKEIPSQAIGQKLVMDLSVPRNVDPVVGKHSEITLLNIDQINRLLKIRKQKMTHVIASTEKMVVSETKQQILIFKQKERYRQGKLPITA